MPSTLDMIFCNLICFIRSTVIKPNQAIRLRARKETVDRNGTERVTGEEWMVTSRGAYLPGAYEEVLDVVDAVVLTEKVMNASYFSRKEEHSKVLLEPVCETWTNVRGPT